MSSYSPSVLARRDYPTAETIRALELSLNARNGSISLKTYTHLARVIRQQKALFKAGSDFKHANSLPPQEFAWSPLELDCWENEGGHSVVH